MNVLSYKRVAHPLDGDERNDDAFVASDLYIDGKSVWEVLGSDPGMLGPNYGMAPLGGGTAEYCEDAVKALLGAPNTPGGRSQILVCEACGDFYCGVVATRIVVLDSTVVWQDFAHENGHAPERSLKPGATFCFDRQEYERVILAAATDNGPAAEVKEDEGRA